MKNTWFTCNLGDAMLAGEALERIRSSIQPGDAGHGAGNIAVFVRHESEGRLHCEVRVFFSPAAAELANAFGAVACARPSASDLGLLAGPETAWVTLFPGN